MGYTTNRLRVIADMALCVSPCSGAGTVTLEAELFQLHHTPRLVRLSGAANWESLKALTAANSRTGQCSADLLCGWAQ